MPISVYLRLAVEFLNGRLVGSFILIFILYYFLLFIFSIIWLERYLKWVSYYVKLFLVALSVS